MILRTAVPTDAPALAMLKRATFRETFVEGFGIPYPPADLAAFEARHYRADIVAAELADPAVATWVVADGPHLAGYAQVGPCRLPHPEVAPEAGELRQLYLLGRAQGGGWGGRMLATALDHLAEHRPGPIWLGVWSGNARAQAIYGRLGFAKVGEYDFRVGAWVDREYILRR